MGLPFSYELDGVIMYDKFSGSHASDLAIGTPVTITYTPPTTESGSVVVGGGVVSSSVSVAAAASVANTAATPCLAVPVASTNSVASTVSSVAASGNAAAASPASVVASDQVAVIGGASDEAATADLAPAGSFARTHRHMKTSAADKVFATLWADVEGINPAAC